jgi:hypothetical protein
MALSRAFVLFAALAAAAQGGCADLKETTYEMRVRDPTRVSVALRGETIVPEGAPFSPRPALQRYGVVYRAERDSRGSLFVERPSPFAFLGPEWTTLVASSGVLTPDIRDRGFQLGATVRAPVCHEPARYGCLTAIDVLTPRDNVSLLVKTVAPSRVTGGLLAGAGALFGAGGGLFLGAGLSDRTEGGNELAAIGGSVLALGIAGLGWAAWYLFTPRRQEVLVGEAVK